MKEFVGGMVTAFGMVAAYNIINNMKKKKHENRVNELLSRMNENDDINSILRYQML